MTSPVASLLNGLLPKISAGNEFASFFGDERRRDILRAVVAAYYREAPADGVVFDTNRSWTGKAAMLRELFPAARIICLVRDVAWVLDSLERILRRNPLQVSRTLNFQTGGSVYSRAEMLMNSETGLVGLAWSTLREAWFSEQAPALIVIDYDRLARDPRGIIQRLYHTLGEPAFAHDFGSLSFDEPDYDAALGMPGLHKVRPQVLAEPRPPCIPPDLFVTHAESNFWARPEMNRRGITIL